MNEDLAFDHTVLGSLIARRWTEERPYYSLDERAHGGWLEASWQRRPQRSGLDLRWSRRMVGKGTPARDEAVSRGARP